MTSFLRVNIGFPDGCVVPLADVERDRATRAKYLERYHGNQGDVHCLCREEGIPMGVGRRTVPYTVFYFYPLHRSDPSRHAFGCPHRIAPSSQLLKTEGMPAVEYRDGKIQVNLAAPLYRGLPVGACGAPPGDADRESNARSRSPRAKLLTLLEVLWSEAELTVWRPWFSKKRHYGVIVHRLREASAKVLLKNGQDLASFLFVPAPYHHDREDELLQQRVAFLDTLKERQGKSYYGYIVALFRGVTESTGGNVGIKIAHTPFRLWIPKNTWRRMERWFPRGNAAPPAALLARVSRRDGRTRPWLAVEDIAILPLSDERSYIPVHSDYERVLSLHLVESGRHFRKPLSCEMAVGEIFPDFILEDREDRLYLEVLGRMADPAYRAQLVEKRATYEQHQQAVWWWDTESQKEIPLLPPSTRPATANAHSQSSGLNRGEDQPIHETTVT